MKPMSAAHKKLFAAAQESARKQGRPRKVNPKVALKLRIDHDVVEAFKAEGPGWQTSMNAALRKAKGLRGT